MKEQLEKYLEQTEKKHTKENAVLMKLRADRDALTKNILALKPEVGKLANEKAALTRALAELNKQPGDEPAPDEEEAA